MVASTYAQHRTAFGQPIGKFPLVAETLARVRADAVACLASTLMLAGFQEQVDDGSISATDAAFFRVAVNLNKLQTSVIAHDAVNRGIEVLGGNGAIETFSVLPRLLRDNVVYENWEGSHNVLRAQVLRDCARLGVHEGFFDALSARLGAEHAEAVATDRAAFEALLERRRMLSETCSSAVWARAWLSGPCWRRCSPCPSSVPRDYSPSDTCASCPSTTPTWRRCRPCSAELPDGVGQGRDTRNPAEP